MPHVCCVPGCRGNYKLNGPKVQVFSFPKDKKLRQQWTHSIKRQDFTKSTHSKVCELHFRENELERYSSAYDENSGRTLRAKLKRPILVPGAVPSQFPNLPKYLSATPSCGRESPTSKRRRKEEETIDAVITESITLKKQYDSNRTFLSLGDLMSCKSFISDFWTLVEKYGCVVFFHLDTSPAPKMSLYSAIIDTGLSFKAFIGGVQLTKLGKNELPLKVTHIDELIRLLDILKNSSSANSNLDIIDILKSFKIPDTAKENSLLFLEEQLSLLKMHSNARRYSPVMLVFSALFFSLSPGAYKFVRRSNNLMLPHPSTIKRLCSSYSATPQKEQCDANFLLYVKQKFSSLSELDKTVTLMVDEIHLKQYFDYKGGSIVGKAHDSNELASSAHVFMINSLLSQYKDVVHVLPVKSLTAETLHEFMKVIIIGLEEIGFRVICVITDNNSVNSKSVSYFLSPPSVQFVYPHPVDSSRPLFFMVDPVHLLKCIRNNWLGQKNSERCMYFPMFNCKQDSSQTEQLKVCGASWSTLQKLHDLEANSLVKFGYNLTVKALSPNNFEKQNVKLALQVFNQFVIQGLMEIGKKHNLLHYHNTAEYLKIILTWWHIMNVKSVYKGTRLNDSLQTPLTCTPTDEKVIFLNSFLNWLDVWEENTEDKRKWSKKKLKPLMLCNQEASEPSTIKDVQTHVPLPVTKVSDLTHGAQTLSTKRSNLELSTGTLTKQTHKALKLSTYAILELASYCITELGFEYILPGKFQTDDLERRFGMYRQMAGSQYDISLRQLFESEHKLRVQSLLLLKVTSKQFGEVIVDNFDVCDEGNDEIPKENISVIFEVSVSLNDISSAKDYLPVLAYLAGYCSFKINRKLKCDYCKHFLQLDKSLPLDGTNALIKNLDRGRLSYPTEGVLSAVTHNYVTINKLCSDFEDKFLTVPNQRAVATSLTINTFDTAEVFGEEFLCKSGHTAEGILKMIISSSTNVFLNNYCKKKNDISSGVNMKTKNSRTNCDKENVKGCKKDSKIRKLQTLTS